jgi:hypothetical protein
MEYQIRSASNPTGGSDWYSSGRGGGAAVPCLEPDRSSFGVDRRAVGAVPYRCARFPAPVGGKWNQELADSAGGTVICHNDVCPENVVFRDDVAVALLDFDFAAPGRPLYDVAAMATMCIPLDTIEDAARTGRGSLDAFRRLRVVADGYGLTPGREEELVEVIEQRLVGLGEFVRRRVKRGEPAFVAVWERMGGQARYDRQREWFAQHRDRFVDALG